MELKQLQYFVTSVDLGSFKKAADALYTTQPHISKTIKALEDELGLTLFHRHPAGVTITEAGKQVYTHASDILRRCGQITQVEAAGQFEPLHLAAVPDPFLARMTARFCAAWTGERLDLRYAESGTAEIIQKLHRHETNLGLVALVRRKMAGFHQLIDKKRLTLEELAVGRPHLFVGPRHPLYHADTVDPSMLRGLQWVQPPDGLFQLQPDALLDIHPDAAGHIETNSPQLARALIAAGTACAVGCLWHGDPDLRAIPIERCESRISLCCLRRGREDLSDAERQFLDFLRADLAGG